MRNPFDFSAERRGQSRARFPFELTGARTSRPCVLQSEAAECGLACLTMIANHHGHRTSLSELRRRFSLSIKGATLRTLMAMADELGFNSRPVKLELAELCKLKTPCVLHWNMTHFVVLTRARSSGIEIHDPAAGVRRLSLDEASKQFTGVAVELTPAAKFRKKSLVERLRMSDLWSHSTGLKGGIAQIVLLSVLLQFFSLLSPLVSQIIIDDVLTKGDRDLLTVLVIGGVLLLLVQSATSAVRSLVTLHLTTMMTFFMRGNLLRHVLSLPIPWFEKRRLGDILSRFNSLQPIQDLLAGGLISLVVDGAMAVLTVAVMLAYAPLLAAVVFISLTILLAVRSATFPIMRQLSAESIQLQAKVDSVVLETLRGARAFRLFGRERERHATWQNAYADAVNSQAKMQRLSLRGSAAGTLLSGTESLLVLFLGARSVIAGEMTIGMLLAFQSYRSQFSSAALSLAAQYFRFRMLELHLDRLSDIVHQDPEVDLEEYRAAPIRVNGSLELKDVGFRYADHEPWVIRGVNLAIKPGEFIALTGPSGGGKSTLLKVMMGLYEPTEGEIKSDNALLRGIYVRGFRENIGVVMQDDQLFAGTIADNISFFDPEIDIARVEEAATAAAIHEDILRMPMGYYTLVGDLGSTLSGGQQQRVLLARALYRRPRIVFLDEGTANLDMLSERRVMHAFAALEVTRVVVAHRPTALEGADRIFAVEGGVARELTRPAPGHAAAAANGTAP